MNPLQLTTVQTKWRWCDSYQHLSSTISLWNQPFLYKPLRSLGWSHYLKGKHSIEPLLQSFHSLHCQFFLFFYSSKMWFKQAIEQCFLSHCQTKTSVQQNPRSVAIHLGVFVSASLWAAAHCRICVLLLVNKISQGNIVQMKTCMKTGCFLLIKACIGRQCFSWNEHPHIHPR